MSRGVRESDGAGMFSECCPPRLICVNLGNSAFFTPPASRSSKVPTLETANASSSYSAFLCHWPRCRVCLQLASHKLRTEEAVKPLGKAGRFACISRRLYCLRRKVKVDGLASSQSCLHRVTQTPTLGRKEPSKSGFRFIMH